MKVPVEKRIPLRQVWRPLLKIVLGLLVLECLISLSPKTAVRQTVFFTGHPVAAVAGHVYHDRSFSQAYHATVYSIYAPYAFLGDSGDENYSSYHIHQWGIFHFATRQATPML